jgi:hypothetical protein
MALTAKKVYAILKRQISDMEAKLNSPVRYRGTVATADLLPLNPDIGDMYNIESKSVYGEAGMNVAWNGVVWDTMGAPIDMSLYLTKEEAETVIQRLVTEYFEKNPVKPGATTEQAQQIEQNKKDVASLKGDLGKLDESFIVEPNNYVDYSKVEKSKKLQQDSDELADSSAFGTTDYIRVKSGEKIFFATGETPQKIPFIKGFNNLKHGVSWDGSVDSYTVPENVIFVRASFYPTWLNHNFQICKGSIKPYSEYHDPYVSVKRNDISYDVRKNLKDNYITCWGDSLTQQGGWTDIISEFSGYPVFNSGIGGETAFTIMGRQGADNITVNNIIIPSDATPVVIGTYAEGGLDTVRGHKAFPLAKPNIVCMNPCSIGGILGNVNWTGTSNTDTNGTWTFTRLENGNKLIIDRPTSIITNYAKYNKGIIIIWIGTNGGYGTESNLVDMNRKMIEHSGCENRYVVLGVCNNTSSALQGYETKMDNEFGSHFINIRKYLSTPIYESDGISLLSSYGLRDAGLEMTEQDKIDIQSGRIPSSLRADSTHFNNYGKSAVGKYIYKRMYELGLFN